jgi:hypothetical protein
MRTVSVIAVGLITVVAQHAKASWKVIALQPSINVPPAYSTVMLYASPVNMINAEKLQPRNATSRTRADRRSLAVMLEHFHA